MPGVAAYGIVVLVTGILLASYLIFVIGRARRRRAEAELGRPAGPATARLPTHLATADPEATASGPAASPSPAPAGEPPVAARSAPAPGGASPAGPPVAEPDGGVAPRPTSDEPVLARLAAGVTLPCGLSPLIDVADRPDVQERAVFVTTDAPGEQVQRELEASFEARGGHISWYTADLGVIRRDGVEANVALDLSPQSTAVGARPAYPTAPPGSVVVDLWV